MPRGGAKPGERRGGRAKGTPNIATADVRAAVAKFTNGTVNEVLAMWRKIAADDNLASKARAIELWARIAALVCPRPTEITGQDGGPVVIEIVKLAEGE